MIRLEPAQMAHFDALLAGTATPEGWTAPAGGVEPPDVLAMHRDRYARLNVTPGLGIYLICAGSVIVGMCGVKQPRPSDPVVEIGYGIAPAWRNRGVATTAIGLLLRHLAGLGVAEVRAETAIWNGWSARVLAANGFVVQGQHEDAEDGIVDCWAITL